MTTPNWWQPPSENVAKLEELRENFPNASEERHTMLSGDLTRVGIRVVGEISQNQTLHLPCWWNWQTRHTQNVMLTRAYRFKSGAGHEVYEILNYFVNFTNITQLFLSR